MIKVELNSLLHKTVKGLHSLNSSSFSDDREYESLLKETITDILKLLDYYERLYKIIQLAVDSSHGDIGNLSLLCYTTESDTNINKELNLIQYLQTYNEDDYSTKNILKQIIQLLTKLHDKKPTRVKDSFTFILVKFSKLLNVFLDIQSVSEQRLLEYLNKCYQYETRYYSSIQQSLETNYEIDEKDTEKIVGLLDSMILGEVKASRLIPEEDDSIFSYASDITNVPKMLALNFKSDDKNFDELYYFFLHILRMKPSVTDYFKYIKVLLNIYKKHNNICSIEINTFNFKELKMNTFVGFLMDKDDKNGAILPEKYKKINERILSEQVVFPEMTPGNSGSISKSALLEDDSREQKNDEGDILVHTDNEEMHIRHYNIEDQNKIISNLKHIIPLLNEFDLNFDFEFPSIFKIYLKYIYNILDFESEMMDYLFINKIVDILNYLVDFENNDLTSGDVLIKEKVDEFYQLHLNLATSGEVNENSSLIMRLSVKEYKDNINTKLLYFKEWNIKTLEVSQLEYNLEMHWIEQSKFNLMAKTLKKWYNKYSKIKNLESEIFQYNEKILMSDVFVVKWKKRMNANKEKEFQALVVSISKFFNIWNSKMKQNHSNSRKAISHDSNRTTGGVLRIWIRRYKQNISAKKQSSELYMTLIERRNDKIKELIWKSWYDAVNHRFSIRNLPDNSNLENHSEINLSMKIRQLQDNELYFIRRKYFKLWRNSLFLQDIFNQTRLHNELLLKKFFFEDEWLKKFRLQQLSNEILRNKYYSEKQNVFIRWKDSYKLITLSKAYNRKRLLCLTFNMWKLKKKSNSAEMILSSNDSVISRVVLENYFKNWLIRFKLSHLISKGNQKLSKRYFKYWKNQHDIIKEQEKNADILLRFFKQRNMFDKWHNKLYNVTSLNVDSVNFSKQKFFKLMIKKYNFFKNDMINAANEYSNFGNLDSKILLKVIFYKWQEAYETKYNESNEYRIIQFRQNLINKNILNNALVKWVDLYNKRKSNLHKLVLREYEFRAISPVKHSTFMKWVASTRSKIQLNHRAGLFEQTLLYKKFLIIWYDQYIRKKIDLEDMCDNYLDQRDFKKVNEILKGWSMKYLKSFRRNEANCNDFIDRWNNTKVRAIFDLWLYKTRELEIDKYPDESYMSITTNASPLTRKAYSQSQIKDRSYLYTPLKLQVRGNRAIDTPVSPRVSPTKLQETTLRLKNERIDALRKHFGKAKKGVTPTRKSSPIKSSDNASTNGNSRSGKRRTVPLTHLPKDLADFMSGNSAFIRLSPPKAKNVKSISPPDPPNFDLKETESVFSDLSASTEIVKDNLEDEASVIETAKKLRRITPILFPNEEMEIEPKFSPVNELKERLRNNYFSLPSNDDEVF